MSTIRSENNMNRSASSIWIYVCVCWAAHKSIMVFVLSWAMLGFCLYSISFVTIFIIYSSFSIPITSNEFSTFLWAFSNQWKRPWNMLPTESSITFHRNKFKDPIIISVYSRNKNHNAFCRRTLGLTKWCCSKRVCHVPHTQSTHVFVRVSLQMQHNTVGTHSWYHV